MTPKVVLIAAVLDMCIVAEYLGAYLVLQVILDLQIRYPFTESGGSQSGCCSAGIVAAFTLG